MTVKIVISENSDENKRTVNLQPYQSLLLV